MSKSPRSNQTSIHLKHFQSRTQQNRQSNFQKHIKNFQTSNNKKTAYRQHNSRNVWSLYGSVRYVWCNFSTGSSLDLETSHYYFNGSYRLAVLLAIFCNRVHSICNIKRHQVVRNKVYPNGKKVHSMREKRGRISVGDCASSR